MRKILVSACMSLSILALVVGTGIWLLRRGDREAVPSEPPSGTSATLDGRMAPGAGLAVDAAGAASGKEPEGPGTLAASVEGLDGSEVPISIEGRVTDASGSGVAGARVAAVERRVAEEAFKKDSKLLEREPLQALRAFQRSLADIVGRMPSCRTAEDGMYALRGLPDGDHRVIVTCAEYLPHGRDDWILVETGKTARYDVELVAGHAISGVARDTKGVAVAGVAVRAIPVETARLKGLGKLVQVFIAQTEGATILEASPAQTDARGEFRLTSLEPGTYDLRLVKEGYAWGEARGVASGSEGIAVTMEPAIRVSGRVVSAAGKEVPGAEVVLREPVRDLSGPAGPMAVAFVDVDVFGEKERHATTDDAGRFILDAFSAGSYELVVRADGFPEYSVPITVEGSPVELGDIVLDGSKEIAGRVLSPDGGPVEGAEVWVPKPSVRVEDRDSRRISVLEAGPAWSTARSQTDRRGEFRLTGVGGQARDLAVLADGYPGDLREIVPGGGETMTIVLGRGLTVRGRVIDQESRDPLPGAKVDVVWDPAGTATTDADGRFELRGVRFPAEQSFGGTIPVRASRDGFHEAQQAVALPEARADASVSVELELRRPAPGESQAEILGIVRDQQGAPIADALVWVEVPGWPRAFFRMLMGNELREVRTGPDGTFAIPVPRIGGTTFDVLASRPGLATSRAGPYPQNAAEEGWPFVEIQLGEGASVEGRVTSLDGAPVPGARIRFWRGAQVPAEATIFTQLLPQAIGESTYSSKDGTYRLRGIEPGSYQVEARAQGYAAKAFGPVEIRAEIAAAAQEGPAGAGSPTRVDIALDAGGSLAGRVVDPDERPIPGIEVVAFPAAEASGPPAEEQDELVVTGALGAAAASTGADGTYELDHLPEGEFRVLARGRGFEPASLTAAAPDPSLPDLVLLPHARIRGRVRDAETGAPVRNFGVRLERKQRDGSFQEDHRKSRDVEDPEGEFACEGLRPGEWQVRVESGEHFPWRRTVTLAPRGEAELDVALDRGCRIAGVVTDPDGALVAGATIFGRIEGEVPQGKRRDLGAVRSGQGGEFAFAGLDPGTYRILAVHPDFYGEDPESTANLNVSAGEDATARLVLRPAGKILGRIRGLSFEPPGTDLWIIAFSPIAPEPAGSGARGRRGAEGSEAGPQVARPFQCWADETGAFHQESVRPGRYRLELTHKRSTPETGGEWVVVPPESVSLGEIEIRAGEMARFEGVVP